MKVKVLIKQLQALPPNHEVVLSKDAEGNGFSPLADIGVYMYVPDSTWSGSVVGKEDAEEQDEKYQENSVVLWPTN